MGALVGARPVESDREGRDRLTAMAAAKAKKDRRVEPAADIADDRDVATEPALDRLLEQRLQLVDERCRVVQPAFVAGVGKVEVPVAMLADPSVTNPEKMTRWERLDPLEERAGRARAKEREEMVDPTRIGPGGHQARGEDGLDLRAPDQPAVGLGIIQGADADPIAARE